MAAALVAVATAVAPLLLVAAPAAASAAPPGVVVLLVPDLRWSDVAAMPGLASLEERSAVGVMSVRSEGAATRCGDGLLELSAGTRVPSGVTGCAISAATLADLRHHYRHSRYGARLGLLGDGLSPHAVAIDDAAASAVATSLGSVRRAPSITAAFGRDPAAVVVAVDDGLYTGRDRARAAAAVDAQLAAQLAAVPSGATAMVVGCSDAARGGPHLHPLVITGPGWTHRALSSASTGRAPYVQLFDVTATLLVARHASLPETVSGRPVHVTSQHVRAPSAYVDDDRHARRALTVGHPTFTTVCAILLGCLLLVATGRRDARVLARWVARLLVLTPLATWIIQLVPWWRWSVAAYALTVAALAVVGALVVGLLSIRAPRAAWVIAPAVTAAVLMADQLVGAPLQLSAPWGDNPLVAGRFHGMGNLDFAVAEVSLLACAAWLATAQRLRPRGVGLAAGLCVLGVAVDGLPQLGDDVGGVLALVPAAALLLAMVTQTRVSWRRATVVVGAALLLAVGAAVADYQRPSAHQTHAGRFVGQVMHGGAWRIVHRKLDAVLASVANPVVIALVVVVAVAAFVTYRRPQTLAVRAAAAAGLVLALLGSLLNDSGVFVAAAAALALVPALLAFAPPADARGDNQVS